MFSTLGLFKEIPCPATPGCSFESCLFSHDSSAFEAQTKGEPPFKKHKVDSPHKDDNLPVSRDLADAKTDPSSRRYSPSKPGLETSPKFAVTSADHGARPDNNSQNTTPKLYRADTSRERLVSNPEIKKTPSSVVSATSTANNVKDNLQTETPIKVPKKELLQPRTMSNPPATHPIRFKLLLLIHEQLVRLNKLVADSKEPLKDALVLTDQELITMAVDEEYHPALSNSKVYANVMKNRIGSLKKVDLKSWVAERTIQVQKSLEHQQLSQKRKFTASNERIVTSLTYEQETQILSQLVASANALKDHSYIASIPTEADLEKSRAGINAAKNWEVCDRCGCRFRAFPTRQEDGTITTGGSCRHHWGRLGPQPRNTGAKPIYSCCQMEQGQPGCEEKPSHVFKVSNPQRLATIIQFESTPENEAGETNLQPVCFDCEMAYTSYGMELIRLTAVVWPSGDPLLDVLVRPKGEVLDLNTRFSGVSIQQWTQAKPWNSMDLPPLSSLNHAKHAKLDVDSDVSSSKVDATALPIVPSPEHARSLLFKLVSPTTPLIGHALENDLIAVRIVHPTIIDTVILYPHKRGLPMKNKLKFLVRDEIQWNIQDSGSDGHDSLEDALAAGELVRHKVRVKWEVLKRNGWTFEGKNLISPGSSR